MRNGTKRPISEVLLQKLSKIFMSFSDAIEMDQPKLTAVQAHFLINHFFRLNRPNLAQYSIHSITRSDLVSFDEFIYTCDLLFPNKSEFEVGFILYRKDKKMNYIRKRKKWSIFWCTVLPGKISLKSLNNVVVDKEIVMHVDRNAILREEFVDHDLFCWSLSNADKDKYLFGHLDKLKCSQWMSGMDCLND
ncbi:unnamed protein product [Dracunculus medinensis]|uniref:FERM domain-containing protein n=1 Tax=Dracunculus medinensis TaxID=318479 RepID=A0A0N4UQ64_DRAME|nr:unnamed protein product [Dracunculus medinensis]